MHHRNRNNRTPTKNNGNENLKMHHWHRIRNIRLAKIAKNGKPNLQACETLVRKSDVGITDNTLDKIYGPIRRKRRKIPTCDRKQKRHSAISFNEFCRYLTLEKISDIFYRKVRLDGEIDTEMDD